MAFSFIATYHISRDALLHSNIVRAYGGCGGWNVAEVYRAGMDCYKPADDDGRPSSSGLIIIFLNKLYLL